MFIFFSNFKLESNLLRSYQSKIYIQCIYYLSIKLSISKVNVRMSYRFCASLLWMLSSLFKCIQMSFSLSMYLFIYLSSLSTHQPIYLPITYLTFFLSIYLVCLYLEIGRKSVPNCAISEPHITSFGFISSMLNHFPISYRIIIIYRVSP